MKIGLLGGTFDPVHYGHLIIAEWARDVLSLDRLFFIPAFIPPHKQDKKFSQADVRMEMVKRAIDAHPTFEVSDFEVMKHDVSFSIDTILYFKKKFNLNASELFFIIGSDSLKEFGGWRQPARIVKNCTLTVYPRYDIEIASEEIPSAQTIIMLQAPIIDISSTMIRERIAQHKSIRYLVPDSVERYIRQYRIYEKKA
jgi:nicotinate-nucleotide adenylyltransferase